MELNDKVAVITGGDSGIGFASARLFLEAGADVVIMSNNRETLSPARSQLGAKTMAIEADVTDTKALHSAFAQVGRQFGRIDVLFASAGVVFPTPLENTSSDLFERILRINVAGSIYTGRAVGRTRRSRLSACV
ncbi:MAG: SDR family NAD(P)-dependent oxidoreductase [Paraburkholderia sp.]|uniref:SDR family NAD(P)-dependent oxidoreductase n=1 Tax=Paraburkholderia sp. TaxID=1926495 RepID=UPI003C3FFE8D